MRPLHRLNPVRLAYIRDDGLPRFGRDPRSARPLDGLDDPRCRLRRRRPVRAARPSRRHRRPGSIRRATNIDGRAAARGARRPRHRLPRRERRRRRGARRDASTSCSPWRWSSTSPTCRPSSPPAAAAVKPGGLLVMATINRTLRAFALAIVGAEYVLGWLPKGTHQWDKFVTPDELAAAVEAGGLSRRPTRRGVVYNPLADRLVALPRHRRQLHDRGRARRTRRPSAAVGAACHDPGDRRHRARRARDRGELRARLRAGRAERQQGGDRRAAPLRRAPLAVAAERRAVRARQGSPAAA